MAEYARPVPLELTHNVDDFDCGSPALSGWLRRFARIATATGTGRVYVSVETTTDVVVGYYALAAGELAYADAPARLTKGVGRHPIPVVILTRLGVHIDHQRKGLGRSLVVDALQKVEAAAGHIGVRALLIHSESEAAKVFYMSLAEFDESPSDPLHLVLLMKDLRRALREPG